MIKRSIGQLALIGLMLASGNVLAQNTCDMYGVSGDWQNNEAKVTIGDGLATYHHNNIGGKPFETQYNNVECYRESSLPLSFSDVVHVKYTYKYQYGKNHDLWLKKVDDHRMEYRYSDSDNNYKDGELYRT